MRTPRILPALTAALALPVLATASPAPSAPPAPASPAVSPAAWTTTTTAPATARSRRRCGVERWSVKTGTDAAARRVDVRHPRPTTVEDLDAAAAPDQPQGRQPGLESTAWTVRAVLLRYKLENDGDYHLVLQGSDGGTLIAELPNPSCVGTSSPWRRAIAKVRRAFDDRYQVTRRMRRTHKTVTLTGVGFFDEIHGQSGVAPNGVELHPVLSIRF